MKKATRGNTGFQSASLLSRRDQEVDPQRLLQRMERASETRRFGRVVSEECDLAG
jgi:hypothetical protein